MKNGRKKEVKEKNQKDLKKRILKKHIDFYYQIKKYSYKKM
jgi:hypothetical protein